VSKGWRYCREEGEQRYTKVDLDRQRYTKQKDLSVLTKSGIISIGEGDLPFTSLTGSAPLRVAR
jgi:hypothetical protein